MHATDSVGGIRTIRVSDLAATYIAEIAPRTGRLPPTRSERQLNLVEDAMEQPSSTTRTNVLFAAHRAGLVAAQDNLLDVLVRIQAPDAAVEPATERPPLALALVIDRSGSMSGVPLHEAKNCGLHVVSCLRPTDLLSVVQFDSRVDTLWPAVAIGDGQDVRSAIHRITSGGNTDLHGGWFAGAQSLKAVEGSGVKRVMLLSDGCANAGITDAETIAAECAAWAAIGITTSTYGLGNHFNEDLMLDMARAGAGSNYYGDTAQDLMDPFQREMGLLANLHLRQAQVVIDAPSGVQASMMNNLLPRNQGWSLPDIACGAEAWVLLRLHVSADAVPALGETMEVVRVVIAGQDADGNQIANVSGACHLPVMSAVEFAALPENELVTRRRIEIEAGNVLNEVRDAARSRRWDEADQLVADALQRFASNDWVTESLRAMQQLAASRSLQRTSKEALLASSRMHARLADKDEDNQTRGEGGKAAYLRRKPLQGKDDS